MVTLTPDGPLFDGRAGRQVVYRRTFTKERKSTAYWYPSDIPLGRYTATFHVEQPGATPRPLTAKKSLDFKAEFRATVKLEIQPSDSSGASHPVQVAVKP